MDNGKNKVGLYNWMYIARPERIDREFQTYVFEVIFRLPDEKLGLVSEERIKAKLETFMTSQIEECAKKAVSEKVRRVADTLLKTDPKILVGKMVATLRAKLHSTTFQEVLLMIVEESDMITIQALQIIGHEKARALLQKKSRAEIIGIQKGGYIGWPKSDVDAIEFMTRRTEVSAGRDTWRDERESTTEK